jgi:hypothetical protein
MVGQNEKGDPFPDRPWRGEDGSLQQTEIDLDGRFDGDGLAVLLAR